MKIDLLEFWLQTRTKKKIRKQTNLIQENTQTL